MCCKLCRTWAVEWCSVACVCKASKHVGEDGRPATAARFLRCGFITSIIYLYIFHLTGGTQVNWIIQIRQTYMKIMYLKPEVNSTLWHWCNPACNDTHVTRVFKSAICRAKRICSVHAIFPHLQEPKRKASQKLELHSPMCAFLGSVVLRDVSCHLLLLKTVDTFWHIHSVMLSGEKWVHCLTCWWFKICNYVILSDSSFGFYKANSIERYWKQDRCITYWN